MSTGCVSTCLITYSLLLIPSPASARAIYWLGWLAQKMDRQSNGPTRDLRWWKIPSWIPRWQLRLGAGIALGPVFGVLGGVVLRLVLGLDAWLVCGVIFGLVFGLVGALVVQRGVEDQRVVPRSVTVRWDLRSRPWLAFVLPFVLGLIGVLGAKFSVFGLVFGLVLGLLLGLALGLIVQLMGVWRRPLAATVEITPRLVYQKDVQGQTLSGLILGLAFGLLLPFFGQGLELAFRDRLAFLVGCGLVGLAVGLLAVFWEGAASSLLFTDVGLLARGRMVRFMPLLESALDRQVLRQAGAVYQFRHAELQDRLVERYIGLKDAKTRGR